MGHPFFTIGQSPRSIGEFVALLESAKVRCVADVRTVPRSRTNPQYNRDVLPASLAGAGIAYEHLPALGGLRARSRETPAGQNAFWENASFHNYADYAMPGAFREGLARLREIAGTRRTAIMCSEAVWWRCHRRIVSDYLVHAGVPV